MHMNRKGRNQSFQVGQSLQNEFVSTKFNISIIKALFLAGFSLAIRFAIIFKVRILFLQTSVKVLWVGSKSYAKSHWLVHKIEVAVRVNINEGLRLKVKQLQGRKGTNGCQGKKGTLLLSEK